MNKLFLTLFLCLFSTVLYASEVTLNTTIDKTKITIGDPVKVSVAITYPSELQLATVIKPNEVGQWSCINITTSTKKINNTLNSVAQFELICFSTGTNIIPQIPLTLVKNSSQTYTVFSSTISVNIESTLAKIGDLGDIKDIKEPLNMQNGALAYIILCAILLIAAFLYFKYKNKNLTNDDETLKTKLPPYETAMNELEELLKSELLLKGFVKEYYIRLSEIMRNYISGTFVIETLEKTTQEICNNLKAKSIDKKITSKIKELFENCDLVKFAKFTPAQSQCAYDIEVAKTIVLESMPKEITTESTISNEANV